jgi:hypothetical protein
MIPQPITVSVKDFLKFAMHEEKKVPEDCDGHS